MLFEFGLSEASYLLLPGLLIVPFYQMFMWIEGNRKDQYKSKALREVTEGGLIIQMSEVAKESTGSEEDSILNVVP
jgi:hypothetical protein